MPSSTWVGASATFGAWLTEQVLAGLTDAPSLVIALDGKTVRQNTNNRLRSTATSPAWNGSTARDTTDR